MLNYYKRVELSKYMTKLLRHEPQLLNLTLDSNGWIDLSLFFNKIKENYSKKIFLDDIFYIVENDDKQRFSILDNKIRANQGHNKSLNLNIEFSIFTPTTKLYHGTIDTYIDDIMKIGLIPMNRQYVHLTTNIKTAKNVVLRKPFGKLILLEIDFDSMVKDNIDFFISENNVVLTKQVLPKYLKIV